MYLCFKNQAQSSSFQYKSLTVLFEFKLSRSFRRGYLMTTTYSCFHSSYSLSVRVLPIFPVSQSVGRSVRSFGRPVGRLDLSAGRSVSHPIHSVVALSVRPFIHLYIDLLAYFKTLTNTSTSHKQH